MVFQHEKQRLLQRYYLSIVNNNGSELFPRLCIVEGSTCFADLHQQCLPLGEVFAQTVVYVFSLHVPQALVLQPHLDRHSKGKGEKMLNFCKSTSLTYNGSGKRGSVDDYTLTYCSTSPTMSSTALYASSRAAGPSGIRVRAFL